MNQVSAEQIIARIQATQRRGTTCKELAGNLNVCQSIIGRLLALASVRHNLEHHTNRREGEQVFTWRHPLFPDGHEADELTAVSERMSSAQAQKAVATQNKAKEDARAGRARGAYHAGRPRNLRYGYDSGAGRVQEAHIPDVAATR